MHSMPKLTPPRPGDSFACEQAFVRSEKRWMGMAAVVSVSKRVEELRVDHPRAEDVFIPLGIVEGRQPGPTLAIVGGVHGTEYAAQEVVSRVFENTDAAALSGTLLAVLMADVVAIQQRSMYVNPLDGTNLNRVFPGTRDRGLTQAL